MKNSASASTTPGLGIWRRRDGTSRPSSQVIDPSGRAARTQAAHRFEASKPDLMEGVDPFPDLRAFLEEVRAVGVDVCVCSSTRRELVLRWIDRHRLGEYFRVVDGWSPEHDKAAQVQAVLDWSGLPADRCLVVGDSRRDGQLAASLGMQFRGVLRRGTSNLEGSGFAYAPDLRSISAAVAKRHRLGIVKVPGTATVPHLSTHQPRTAAPTGAAIEQRDVDGVSTGTGSPSDPTALSGCAPGGRGAARVRRRNNDPFGPRTGVTGQ